MLDKNTIWNSPFAPTYECKYGEEEVSYDYKVRAMKYWRSDKTKNFNIETMKRKFRRVTSDEQSRRWFHTIKKGDTYREKIAIICDYTLENFKAAVDASIIVHGNDLTVVGNFPSLIKFRHFHPPKSWVYYTY